MRLEMSSLRLTWLLLLDRLVAQRLVGVETAQDNKQTISLELGQDGLAK